MRARAFRPADLAPRITAALRAARGGPGGPISAEAEITPGGLGRRVDASP
jgi:hypothetical protein